MRISFIGLGYVGLTTAACFASKGHKILCYDVDKEKIARIRKGEPPFYEPGLDELLKQGLEKENITVVEDIEEAVEKSGITFITVGTPAGEDGEIDLSQVREASKNIGYALRRKDKWHLVVVKSTVTPKTTEYVIKPLLETCSGKKCGVEFGLCVNPEFLREGNAVEDTMNPDRVVIGEADARSGDFLEAFYREFYGDKLPPVIRTTPVNAELIKYANNAFLAMKVSFINMIANLCQTLPNADVEEVAKGIGLDKRIGNLFLKAGAGWGGSCWPKDLKALSTSARKIGVELPLIDATIKINETQPVKLVDLAEKLLGSLEGKTAAILGLAFKPGTDDTREAVSIKIINTLLKRGAHVRTHDPKAIDNTRKIIGDKIEYVNNPLECIKDADVAILVTEWPEFKNLKPEDFKRLLKTPCVIDGRRIYDPRLFKEAGIKFTAVGLGPSR